MAVSLKGRDFLTLLDFTTEEILYLLDLAKEFKRMKKTGTKHKYLEGQNIALLFEKTSTRTRCAFEVAGMDLGMGVTYLGPDQSQLGKKESIADTARVLSGMYDGIEFRGFAHKNVEDLAKYACVPVWNGLTDSFHPTQMLADALTIEENFGRYKGLKLVFVGYADACVGDELMVLSAKLGMDYVCCAPKNHFHDPELVKTCQNIAAENGCTITLCDDIMEAAKDADIIYTDVWVALGESDEVWQQRIRDFDGFKVTKEVMGVAHEEAIFMHCLPAFHDLNTSIAKDIYENYGLTDMEVNDDVFESKQSKVFQEAENRMHTIKAVIYATLK